MSRSYPDSDESEPPDIGRRAFQEGQRVSKACDLLARGRGSALLGVAGYRFRGKELLASQREPSLCPQPYVSVAPNLFLPDHELPQALPPS